MDDALFNDLIDGVKEMKAHMKGEATKARIHLPATVDVKSIRQTLGMTQKDFCDTFAIAIRTLKSWESGERKPEGLARILLKMISRDPKTVLELAS